MAAQQAQQAAAAAAAAAQPLQAATTAIIDGFLNQPTPLISQLPQLINIARGAVNNVLGYKRDSERALAAAAQAEAAALTDLGSASPLYQQLQLSVVSLRRDSDFFEQQQQLLEYHYFNFQLVGILAQINHINDTIPVVSRNFTPVIANLTRLQGEVNQYLIVNQHNPRVSSIRDTLVQLLATIQGFQQNVAAAVAQQAQQAAAAAAAAVAAAAAAQVQAVNKVLNRAYALIDTSPTQITKSNALESRMFDLLNNPPNNTIQQVNSLIDEINDHVDHCNQLVDAIRVNLADVISWQRTLPPNDPVAPMLAQANNHLAGNIAPINQVVITLQQQLDQAQQYLVNNEKEQFESLGKIQKCVADMLKVIAITLKPSPAPPPADSSGLRLQIIDEFTRIQSVLQNRLSDLIKKILTLASISEKRDKINIDIQAAIKQIDSLNDCQTDDFTESKRLLIDKIEERLRELNLVSEDTTTYLKDKLDTINKSITTMVGDINIPSKMEKTAKNICKYLDGTSKEITQNIDTVSNHKVFDLADIHSDLTDLQRAHAQCLDEQRAALVRANAYLLQLKNTCGTLKLLPALATAPPPTTIQQADAQISQCLVALMGHLDPNSFLNQVIGAKLKNLNDEFQKGVQDKLNGISDTILDRTCGDKAITSKIKYDKAELIQSVTSELVRVAGVISSSATGIQPFQIEIKKIETELQSENDELLIMNLTGNYTFPKKSTDFITNITRIKEGITGLLTHEFSARTLHINNQIAAFVTKSLKEIDDCHQAGLTAAAIANEKAKAAADRAASANIYLQVLNGIPGAVSTKQPPPSGAITIDRAINSGLNLLKGSVSDQIISRDQVISRHKEALDEEIRKTDAKLTQLRAYDTTRLEICLDPNIVAINKRMLGDIINKLEAALKKLNDGKLERNIRITPNIKIMADGIQNKIESEIRVIQTPNPTYNSDTISTIKDEYTRLLEQLDAFTKLLSDEVQVSTRTLLQVTNDETEVIRHIDECITQRKVTVDRMLEQATIIRKELIGNAIECKMLIDNLCESANTNKIALIVAANPKKSDLISKLQLLKTACDTNNTILEDAVPSLYLAPPTLAFIEKLWTDILGLQQGLNNPAVGVKQLDQLADKASKSAETLSERNDLIKTLLPQLNISNTEINAIKSEIDKIIAEQEAAGVAIAAAAAAAAASVAADAAVAEMAENISVLAELKTKNFSGVTFDPQTGDLILSFGNSTQLLNVGAAAKSTLDRSPAIPGSADDSDDYEADTASAPVVTLSGVGRGGPRVRPALPPYHIVITPESQYYKRFILEFNPQRLWTSGFPEADIKLELGNGMVKLNEGAASSTKIEPTDKLAIAEAAALNPVVVRKLLASVSIDEETLKNYDRLVRLCDKGSAAGVINELLFVNDNLPTTAGIGVVIRKNTDGNMIIYSINPGGGAAATRQVQEGDIILRVNETPVKGMSEENVKAMIAGAPGSNCTLMLTRVGLDRAFNVNVTRIPTTAGIGVTIDGTSSNGEKKIINIVRSGGAAATRQVQVGDIILEVNGRSLLGSTEDDAKSIIAGAPGSECVLTLKRPNVEQPFIVKVRRIPHLPEKNTPGFNASVRDIITKLGWNGSENKVWYNLDRVGHTGRSLLGLFSKFSYDDSRDIFSEFLSATLCKTNYVCMLNWIFLIALRLHHNESNTFTAANIKDLLTTIYSSVCGFVKTDKATYHQYFTNSTPYDGNKRLYVDKANEQVLTKIFSNDPTLRTIVTRIKGELQRGLDESKPLISSPRPASPPSGPARPQVVASKQNPGSKWFGGGHKKKTRRINRKIDSHHTIKKHSNRQSERGGKMTRRRHHKLVAKRRLDRVKTRRSAPVYFSV
jgi:C-terminal processing protease CtpA/Prc